MPTQTQSAFRWKQARWLLFSFAVAAAILTAGAFWMRQSVWINDYSKWQPAAVFQIAIGQPQPPGIIDIHASGRRYLSKKWVWLRFQATDPAMRKLGFFGPSLPAAEAQEALKERGEADGKYDVTDHSRVRWEDISKIAHPIYYPCSTGNTSDWLWQGIVIYDHETHTVFIQAHGD